MSYTFIVLRTDRTDKGSSTFTLSKPFVWLTVLTAIFAPFVAYYYAFNFSAPAFWTPKALELVERVAVLEEEKSATDYENQTLIAQNEALTQQAQTDRRDRSGLEAVVNIAETARTASSKQLVDLEDKVLDLERKLAMYEEFVKPDTDKEVLQCFNITLKKRGTKLTYGINFLKTDQKDKTKLNTRVRLNVFSGADVLNLTEVGSEDASREVTMSLVKDRRLSGSLSIKDIKEGLHILDIKAYDKDENIIAHCWKAF